MFEKIIFYFTTDFNVSRKLWKYFLVIEEIGQAHTNITKTQ